MSRYRCGQRTAAWRKFKGRHETRGEIIGHGQPEADGGDRALVRLEDGRRAWVRAWGSLAVGAKVVVRYSRRDADGSLRDARLAGA